MKRLIVNKKGIYYTLTALIVVAMIIGYNSFDDNSRIKQRGELLQKRAINMNTFLEDVEKDASRMILISGYRSMLSLEKVLSDKQEFLDDFDASFYEMFINGTNNGTTYSLMTNASISDWENRINEEANTLNMNFNIYPKNVIVEHITSWDVKITLNATIILSDYYKDISWNYTKEFSNVIPINDFEDPLYKINSQDKVTNIIVKAPNTDFVNDADNDSTVFQIHLNNSYYFESTTGPSFLMRFVGNTSNNTYGIESFINLVDFQKQELVIYSDRSLIDYIYFSGTPNTQDHCYLDLPSWFAVDNAHKDIYELNKLVEEACS